MMALHEHEELESGTWLSTDTQEELAFLSALADPKARPAAVAHADDFISALVSDDPTWEDTDAVEAPVEDAPAALPALDAGDAETDNLIAQYFGEVRRFPLLSFAQEQALGRRMARWRRRVRWVLYTSPIALPTLRQIWPRVAHQDTSLHEVVQHHEGTILDGTAWRAQCRQAILSLEELATRLNHAAAWSDMPRRVAQKHQGRHHERFRLWRAWLMTWEALQLHPRVHEAM